MSVLLSCIIVLSDLRIDRKKKNVLGGVWGGGGKKCLVLQDGYMQGASPAHTSQLQNSFHVWTLPAAFHSFPTVEKQVVATDSSGTTSGKYEQLGHIKSGVSAREGAGPHTPRHPSASFWGATSHGRNRFIYPESGVSSAHPVRTGE